MFSEDLTPFFDVGGGFASVYTVNGLANDGYRAIFDTQYVEFNGMVGDHPVMTFESFAYTPIVGDAIKADGVNYTVAYSEPEQAGVSRVILERL